MSGPMEQADETALWRRWHSAAQASVAADGAGDDATPDAMSLASYAENRLDEAASEAIERYLAANPETIDDIVMARALGADIRDGTAPGDRAIARALALVHSEATEPNIVPFRRQPARLSGWRALAAWGGIAASIAATGLIGFVLGSDAYTNLFGDRAAGSSQDVFDPPSGFLNGFGEENDT
jgi:hypothetical protein